MGPILVLHFQQTQVKSLMSVAARLLIWSLILGYLKYFVEPHKVVSLHRIHSKHVDSKQSTKQLYR